MKSNIERDVNSSECLSHLSTQTLYQLYLRNVLKLLLFRFECDEKVLVMVSSIQILVLYFQCIRTSIGAQAQALTRGSRWDTSYSDSLFIVILR